MKRLYVFSISLAVCLTYAAAIPTASHAAAKKPAKPATVSAVTKMDQAAAKGDVALMEKLLKADPALIKATDKNGATALHWAVDKGQKAAAEALLGHGADVNARKKNGVTPLHVAAVRGDSKIVGLLLDKGADPNAKDNVLRTPMTVARDSGHKELMDVIAAAAQAAKPPASKPVPVSTYKPTPIVAPELVTLAKKMVSEAAAGRFSAVENSFDDKMKTTMPTGKLKELWGIQVAKDGAFSRIIQSVAQSVDRDGQKYAVISVDCQFARTRRGIEVTVSPTKQISGFFFIPNSFDE